MSETTRQVQSTTQLQLFGVPRYSTGDSLPSRMGHKQLLLLTRLLLGTRPVTRESMIAFLWPEADEARARQYGHRHVANRAAGDGGARAGGQYARFVAGSVQHAGRCGHARGTWPGHGQRGELHARRAFRACAAVGVRFPQLALASDLRQSWHHVPALHAKDPVLSKQHRCTRYRLAVCCGIAHLVGKAVDRYGKVAGEPRTLGEDPPQIITEDCSLFVARSMPARFFAPMDTRDAFIIDPNGATLGLSVVP